MRRYLTQYYAFVNTQILTTEPHPTKSGAAALSMFCGAGMFGVGYVGGRCCRAVYEGPEGRLAMRNVGDEHNFENEVEMERVKATGAEVKKWMVNNVGCVGDTCVWYGPGNPKCGRREPGLSTSRILGFSNATEVGVTAEPTVVVVDLSEPTDTVLYLAASSNFWKILDDDDVLVGQPLAVVASRQSEPHQPGTEAEAGVFLQVEEAPDEKSERLEKIIQA